MARVSSIDPSGHFDYSYARIHQSIVECCAVEVHHGRFHFFFRTFSFDTVVIHLYQVNLKTLKKRLFFPVLAFYLIQMEYTTNPL